jgi:hypothetical protein
MSALDKQHNGVQQLVSYTRAYSLRQAAQTTSSYSVQVQITCQHANCLIGDRQQHCVIHTCTVHV